MFRFVRGIFKWGVIGALLTVGLVAVIGLTRVKTAFHSVRDHLRSNVDELVDTRIALRHEIDKLQKEYPERIAEIRVQLSAIDRDLAKCGEEIQLFEEVVGLAESDAEVLRNRIAGADADADGVNATFIEFRSERLGPEEAWSRAARAADYAASYRERISDTKNQRALLQEEKARLRAELASLEREYRDFKAEIASMNRDIESLKRKEKLVELAERRSGEREDLFTDRATSLQVVQEKIQRRKIELEEKLKALNAFRSQNEYESRARLRLATDRSE